jgi:pimeloyl-ACP methyl ester carboxylesterase
MKHGFVMTSHGRIHYLEAGAGEPLILIHSNGNSGFEYEHVLDRLGGRYRVIACDLPGHGDSDRITRHHSIEDYAGAIVALMDALGLERASLGGSSVGGSICVALGAHHAPRLNRLFVIETPGRSPEQWSQGWFDVEKNFVMATQTLDQIKPRFRDATPELLARWNVDRNKAGGWTMLDVMWAIRQFNVRAALAEIAAPTLLVYGAKGPTIGFADEFQKILPSAKVARVDDSGHFPMIDNPEGFATALLSFP